MVITRLESARHSDCEAGQLACHRQPAGFCEARSQHRESDRKDDDRGKDKHDHDCWNGRGAVETALLPSQVVKCRAESIEL